MRIKWLRLALNNLDEIYKYISSDNPDSAVKILKLILDKSKIIIDHPDIGRPGRVTGTRELFIIGTPFIIPYRIKNNEIEILRILHTSRNWPKEF